jgi:hypothetical protein
MRLGTHTDNGLPCMVRLEGCSPCAHVIIAGLGPSDSHHGGCNVGPHGESPMLASVKLMSSMGFLTFEKPQEALL